MAKEQPAVELPAAERTAVECPTPNGVVIIARDCVANNSKYSKGSVITMGGPMGTDFLYECSGDKDGNWKKLKKEKAPS